MDGVGEWATTSVALGRGNQIEVMKEMRFPHSLGLLYSAFTFYTGFKVNSDEYKVMGLAPYGQPRYAQKILDHLIDLKPDGLLPVKPRVLQLLHRLDHDEREVRPIIWRSGPEARRIAHSAPHGSGSIHSERAGRGCIANDAVPRRGNRDAQSMHNLCLAGGVALNCVANGRVLRRWLFRADLDPTGGR
jgi:carbamoyltransferase